VVVEDAAVEEDRAGWAVPRQVGPEGIAFVPAVGTGSRTQWEWLATRRNAPSVAL